MTLKDAQKVYMVGIKGFGMASLAVVLQGMGKHVSGSDVAEHFPTDELLDAKGISHFVFGEHEIEDDTDVVIVTAAHGGLHNPEVTAAEKRGIPILSHGEALGQTMDLFPVRVAVCGTHGKTTTSALLSYALDQLGEKFAYQVGTSEFSGMPGGRFTGSNLIVVESDEYFASPKIDDTPRFLYQNPTTIICTSIEYDHPDVYPTFESYKEAFHNFFIKLKDAGGELIYCLDDAGAREVAASVDGIQKFSYGMSKDADYIISGGSSTDGTTHFTLEDTISKKMYLVQTSLFGKHNMLNATAVLIQLIHMHRFDEEKLQTILTTFTSSKLRFQILYESPTYAVIDDYAHHPTEILALLDGTRSKYPDRRIVLVFQPHMVSRTRALKNEFIEALHTADQAFLLDIFVPPREDQADSLTSELIAHEAQTKGYSNVRYASESDALKAITAEIREGDVIVLAGANTKFNLQEGLIAHLKTT